MILSRSVLHAVRWIVPLEMSKMSTQLFLREHAEFHIQRIVELLFNWSIVSHQEEWCLPLKERIHRFPSQHWRQFHRFLDSLVHNLLLQSSQHRFEKFPPRWSPCLRFPRIIAANSVALFPTIHVISPDVATMLEAICSHELSTFWAHQVKLCRSSNLPSPFVYTTCKYWLSNYLFPHFLALFLLIIISISFLLASFYTSRISPPWHILRLYCPLSKSL